MSKHMPLPNLKLLQEIFDWDEQGNLYWKKKICQKVVVGKPAGCRYLSPNCQTEYYQTKVFCKTYKNHRILYFLYHKVDPADYEIDHIDGNGLNNAKSNLRLAIRRQQLFNTSKRKKTSSKFKGVSRQNGKWQAYINLLGKKINLGYYNNEFYAALVYARAAKQYFVDFAEYKRKSLI